MPTKTAPRVRRRGDARKRRRVLPPDRDRRATPVDGITLDGRRLDMQVGDRIIDATLERSIETADFITLTLYNGDRAVLTNGVLGGRLMNGDARIELDGLGYIAAGVTKRGDQLDIPFEDEIVVYLKRHGQDRPLRRSRSADMTRLHFCATMIRQAGVPVLVLDENVPLPIQGRRLADDVRRTKTATGGRLSSRSEARPTTPVASWADQTYPRHYLDQTAGKTRFTARQVYTIALQAGLPARAFEQIAHGESSYYPGVVQRDPGDGNIGYGLWQITPHAWNGDPRLLGELARLGGTDGMRNPWKCALMARFMYDISGLSPWVRTRHLDAAGRASKPDPRYKHPVAPTGTVGSIDTANVKPLAYERKRNESTWAAAKRLLDEVNIRLFVREGVAVIGSDPALMRARPAIRIDEHSDAFENVDFDWHRGLRLGEMTVTAYVGRWQADPGEVATVTALPQTNGDWLIATVRESLLVIRPLAEIGLQAPTRPKPEPSDTTTSSSGTSLSTEVEDLYAACEAIDRQNLPYVWGGGHAHAGTPDGGTGRDPGTGYDCSGATGAALAAVGLGFKPGAPVYGSGTFAATWGEPGRGKFFTVWANASHVFIELNYPGKAGKSFDTRRIGDNRSGPHIRGALGPTAGFTPRHWPGS